MRMRDRLSEESPLTDHVLEALEEPYKSLYGAFRDLLTDVADNVS